MDIDKQHQRDIENIDCDTCEYADECDPRHSWECKLRDDIDRAYENAVDRMIDEHLGK